MTNILTNDFIVETYEFIYRTIILLHKKMVKIVVYILK